MRFFKRDRPILHCGTCGQDKPCREFYVSNLSVCMECKRQKVANYKSRTSYNRIYKRKKAA